MRVGGDRGLPAGDLGGEGEWHRPGAGPAQVAGGGSPGLPGKSREGHKKVPLWPFVALCFVASFLFSAQVRKE